MKLPARLIASMAPQLRERDFEVKESDIKSMSATIDLLAGLYSSKQYPPLVEERVVTLAKVEMVVANMELIDDRGKEMLVKKDEEEERATMEEKMSTMEEVVINYLEPVKFPHELAQPQGGFVSGAAPAPLPAYQPLTFLSKPLAPEDAEVGDCVDFGGGHMEEMGLQTAFRGELIALMPKVEEVFVSQQVEMVNDDKVEEVIVKQDDGEVVLELPENLAEVKERVSDCLGPAELKDAELPAVVEEVFLEQDAKVDDCPEPALLSRLECFHKWNLVLRT